MVPLDSAPPQSTVGKSAWKSLESIKVVKEAQEPPKRGASPQGHMHRVAKGAELAPGHANGLAAREIEAALASARACRRIEAVKGA